MNAVAGAKEERTVDMTADKQETIRLTRREALQIGFGLCAASTQMRAEEAPRRMPAKDAFADTPPMGWNTSGSYNLAGENEEMVKRGVDAIVQEGLKDAGYTVVLIDYGWYQDEHGTTTGTNPLTRCDAFGRYIPNADRFPQGFKPLADCIHAQGMKLGLHLMRGIYRGALFNLMEQPSDVEQSVVELGFKQGCRVRDIWQQSDRGTVADRLTANIPGHGVAFHVLSPP